MLSAISIRGFNMLIFIILNVLSRAVYEPGFIGCFVFWCSELYVLGFFLAFCLFYNSLLKVGHLV